MAPLEGGCLCGAVAIVCPGRHTASPIAIAELAGARAARRLLPGGFDIDKFAFTKGKPASYRSSPKVVRNFCGRCGTALTYRRADLPKSIDVTVASIDDPEALRPADHTWTESRLSWIALGDHLPAYPRERKLA